MDNITFTGTAHKEVLRAWLNAMSVCGYESVDTITLGYIDYVRSLQLARAFVSNLAENPEFDMSRVKVYDWGNGDDILTVFVTVDGHIYDRDMNSHKVATRSVLEAMFIYHAGKAAMTRGVCYYLENGERDKDADYFCVTPWGESTKWGEPYRPIKNNIYTGEEFLNKISTIHIENEK